MLIYDKQRIWETSELGSIKDPVTFTSFCLRWRVRRSLRMSHVCACVWTVWVSQRQPVISLSRWDFSNYRNYDGEEKDYSQSWQTKYKSGQIFWYMTVCMCAAMFRFDPACPFWNRKLVPSSYFAAVVFDGTIMIPSHRLCQFFVLVTLFLLEHLILSSLRYLNLQRDPELLDPAGIQRPAPLSLPVSLCCLRSSWASGLALRRSALNPRGPRCDHPADISQKLRAD